MLQLGEVGDRERKLARLHRLEALTIYLYSRFARLGSVGEFLIEFARPGRRRLGGHRGSGRSRSGRTDRRNRARRHTRRIADRRRHRTRRRRHPGLQRAHFGFELRNLVTERRRVTAGGSRAMLEFGDLIVLTANLLLQTVDLLAIARDHPAQRKLILIELLQIAALRTASRERQCYRERGGAD